MIEQMSRRSIICEVTLGNEAEQWPPEICDHIGETARLTHNTSHWHLHQGAVATSKRVPNEVQG